MAGLGTFARKSLSLFLTPLFYGVHKLYKSLNNLLDYYKPVRSFFRAGIIISSLCTGAFWGSLIGTMIFPVVGTFIGGIFGALATSSVGAYLGKQLLRAISWLAYTTGYSELKKSISLAEVPTNPEKYAIPRSTFQLFCDYFQLKSKDGTTADPSKIHTLCSQVEAVKKAKSSLGFWSSFWGTPENAEKKAYNKLLAEIKKNPIAAVQEGTVQIDKEHYRWEDGRDGKDGTWNRVFVPYSGTPFHI